LGYATLRRASNLKKGISYRELAPTELVDEKPLPLGNLGNKH